MSRLLLALVPPLIVAGLIIASAWIAHYKHPR
jgi:hypothetical protein